MFPLRDTQPSYTKPVVTIIVIAINVFVFLYELSLDDWTRNAFVGTFGLVPDHFVWASLITSTFLHGGWLHLLGNMWFLWIFGDNIERRFGSARFLLFYLVAGVVASFAQIWAGPNSVVPNLGASGAIAGVLGAYIALFPGNRVTILIFTFIPFAVPALFAIGIWAVLQFVNGFGQIAVTQETGGVAYLAHVGGFVFGFAAGLFLRGRTRPSGTYAYR